MLASLAAETPEIMARRLEMVRRQVFGKIENRVQRLAIMPGITRLPQQALNIEPLEEEKFHIPARQYQ